MTTKTRVPPQSCGSDSTGTRRLLKQAAKCRRDAAEAKREFINDHFIRLAMGIELALSSLHVNTDGECGQAIDEQRAGQDGGAR